MSAHFEEVKIHCEEDCGNAPKKELLKDLTISFVKNDLDFCIAWLRDDIIWEMVGDDNKLEGIDDVKVALHKMSGHPWKELYIYHIITHGNIASLNGTLVRHDESKVEFCNVYHFGGFGKKAKIKKIMSYIINTKQ